MSDLFKEALARVLVHEGGKSNHPDDPGGRTNKGITQRVYNGWRSRNSLPVRDVYLIDDREVEAIYRFQYWEPVKGDALPIGLGYVVFDGAVNSGPSRSVRWLQRALANPDVKIDGALGAVTLSKTKENTDHDRLIAAICERRMAFLKALKTWKTFGKGWTSRVSDVKTAGQAWAMGSVPAAAEYIEGANRKALEDDVKSPPPSAPASVGMSAGGGTAVTSQLIEWLQPLSGMKTIGTIIVWLTVAGVVVGGLAFLYGRWAAAKKAKIDDALDVGVTA